MTNTEMKKELHKILKRMDKALNLNNARKLKNIDIEEYIDYLLEYYTKKNKK